MNRLIPILVCLACCTAALAQQPAIELRMTPQVLEPGEAIVAQIVCTNIADPEAPTFDAPDGIEVTLDNPNPQVFSSTSIINGKMSQTQTYTYVMRLTAKKVGTWDVGPFRVKAGGQTYQTGPARVVVRKPPPETAKAKGDSLVYVEVEVEPKSLYVSEVCTAVLRIGFRRLTFNGRPVDADLLASTLDQRGSQLNIFSGTFAGRKYSAADKQFPEKSGQRHTYVEYTLTTPVRAEQAGDLVIGPVFVKVNYPTELARDVFGNLSVRNTEKVTARAEAVSVRVKTPPVEGRPDSYNGAIGRFNMYVSAAPTRVPQGQPITLSIEIAGEPLAGVSGPDLAAQPELASRFDFQQEELAGELERGVKVFRRAIFPRQQGEQTIPPIAWSFFDTKTEKYVTVTSEAIPVVVDPPSSDARPLVLSGVVPPADDETKLTVIAGGISPNYADASALLADQRFALGPGGYAILGATPLAYATIALLTRRRARLRGDVRYARKTRALSRAEGQVRRALRLKPKVETSKTEMGTRADGRAAQLHGLAAALAGFVGDRCGLGTGVLTPAEVRDALLARGADEEVVKPIVAFLESSETLRYAPGTAEELDPQSAADKVREWLAQIERATR